VSALSGQRNENSVLFSLDSLSSVATGNKSSTTANASTPMATGSGDLGGGGLGLGGGLGDGGGGGGGGGGLGGATTATAEGSGLIDIRSMGAMLGAGGAAADPANAGMDDLPAGGAALPSFGGSGFGGLASAPLTIEPSAAEQDDATVVPEPVVQPRSNGPLYAVIAILTLGLGAIGAYVFTRPPPTAPKEIVKVIQPGQTKTIVEYRDRPAAESGEDDGEDDGEDVIEEGDDEGSSGTKKSRKGKKKGGKTSKKASGDSGSGSGGGSEPAAATKKKSTKAESVECLLNPNAPGCKVGGGSKKKKKADSPPAGNLPDKLGLSDLKAGVKGPKSAAKSKCKSKGSGKIKVKLSIKGSTGRVTSATPTPSNALGKCVAAEMKKSKFKKFKKSSLGYQTSVTI
jgi:hypothetical protein